jgi:phenylacetate-coenzyme A ligase PaaK-like adenylate-forming protein
MHFPADVDAITKHLENAQWWPEEIMRRHQFELLKPLLAHAYQTVPWYRRRFDELGLSPDRVADPDVFHTLPPLRRQDVQNAGELLHSTDVPSSHGKVWPRWTSGSTGMPVMVLRTVQTGRFWIANTLREYRWQGWDFSRKVAVIQHTSPGKADPPQGATLENWGPATAGRIPTGPCAVLSLKSTTAEQAAWLVREQPAYVQMYPLVAYELARYFLRTGQQLHRIKSVHTVGGVVEPRVREACRAAWGADVWDAFSASEVGHIAIECLEGGSYHVQSEHLLVEVLDDSGRPCAPGETGRVVITDLFNYAMPLLRYEIADYAEVGGTCPCGRKLPTLRRILGRQRNMLVLPNGEMLWPVLELETLGAFKGNLPVRQFQVIQHTRTDLEVKLVVDRLLTSQEEAALRAVAAKWFSEDLLIRFTYVDHIPRGPTGKFEDFICEISREG